jgi:hypothetical protein
MVVVVMVVMVVVLVVSYLNSLLELVLLHQLLKKKIDPIMCIPHGKFLPSGHDNKHQLTITAAASCCWSEVSTLAVATGPHHYPATAAPRIPPA